MLKFSLFRATLVLLSLSSVSCSNDSSSSDVKDDKSTSQGLGVNDVSILIPAKSVDEGWTWAKRSYGTFDTPLHTSDIGSKGELLPKYIIDAVKAQMLKEFTKDGEKITNSAHSFDLARIMPVGIRFDPCAPRIVDDEKDCLAQIRLVWQPGGNVDAAIHSIHDLSRKEFQAAMLELASLKAKAGFDYSNEALGPHPVMKKEGLDGPYAKAVFAMVKRLAGANNISSIAAFTFASSTNTWRFAAFTHKDGQLKPENIIHQGLPIQQFEGFYRGVLFKKNGSESLDTRPQLPGIPFSDGKSQAGVGLNPTEITAKGKLSLAAASPEQKKAAFDFLLGIENPAKVTVLSNACADCHLASQQRLAMEEEIPGMVSGLPANPNRLPLFTGSLHNFGYHGSFAGSGPSVSQRTINETKEVVKWVNSKYFAQP